jgi:hypothetical protein
MIAGMILACSVVFLLQFFVSYCRSLIAASGKHPLSAEVQDVTGISSRPLAEDFARVVQLLQLCPDRPDDRGDIQAVGAYFRLLGFLRAMTGVVPSVRAWTEKERDQCTYFAVVALDRRIAFSRDMMAQQIES